MLAGPVVIANNLFLHPSGGINGAQLKMIPSDLAESPSSPVASNLTVHHNAAFGNWLCWATAGRYENVTIHDNVFCTSHRSDPPWPQGINASGNVLTTSGAPAASTVEMLAQLDAATVDKSHGLAKEVVDQNRQLLQKRPGPAWLDWSTTPATKSLVQMLQGEQK